MSSAPATTSILQHEPAGGRARAASVRVRRLGDGTAVSDGQAVAEAAASPLSTTSGRRRAVTISEHLQERFERDEMKATAVRRGSDASGSNRPSVDILEPSVQIAGRPRAGSRASGRRMSVGKRPADLPISEEELHAQEEVDLLDVVDPQVSTATYLSNFASAVAIPPLPFVNRAPVVDISTPTLSRQPTLTREEAFDRHVETAVDRRAKRKAQYRKIAQGLWAFMKTPVGIFFTIYGICVVFFGAGLVLILMRAIPMPSDERRNYIVEVFSQVLNGLFTITGVGLIPWRVIDTYRAACIWTYANRVWRRRKARGLAPLPYRNDLPQRQDLSEASLENRKVDSSLEKGKSEVIDEATMMSEQEERKLLKHQLAFQKSQTWFRPHETATHRAFPLRGALIITLLNDGNSVFQCCLCGTMWGISYKVRPTWTTALLIPLSFLCGIGAGVMIYLGGRKSKKTEEVEAAVRAASQEKADAVKSDGTGDGLSQNPPLASSV